MKSKSQITTKPNKGKSMSKQRTLPPINHPGLLLKKGIDGYGISQYRLGKDLGIAHSTVTGICLGRQTIPVPVALKLGKYLGTSAEYWINLQKRYDMETQCDAMEQELEAIRPARELVNVG
jgi:addiction module HigA family antidote